MSTLSATHFRSLSLLVASLTLILFAYFPRPVVGQTAVYVDKSNTPTGCTGASSVSDLDGSSWECAYPALQDGFDEANAGSGSYEIRVATGMYFPDTDNVANDGNNDGSQSSDHTADDQTESFTISRDQIMVLGGYPPGGGTRDPDANNVTLSGDIDGTSGDDDVFAPETDSDGTASTPAQTDHINGGNAYHVISIDGRTNNITSSTEFDGVTVTGGAALGSFPNNAGGGIYCDARGTSAVCSPSFIDVTIEGNAASFGGGVFLNTDPVSGEAGTASPTFTDAVIHGNAAESDRGGGVHLSIVSGGNVQPVFENSTFSNNFASGRGGGLHIFAREGSVASPDVLDCTFTNNEGSSGGGVYTFSKDNGTRANIELTRVTFSSNVARSDGGAIYNRASAGGTANPTVTNTNFIGNQADRGGAAFINGLDNGTEADPYLLNVTITQNEANSSGGGVYTDGESSGGASARPVIENSILWANVSDANNTGAGSGDEMFNIDATAEPSVSFSIVEGGCSSIGGNQCGSGNLDQDPQFIDPTDPDGTDDTFATPDDGLQLRGAGFATPSPAIDAGDNAPLDTTGDGSRDITADILGNTRVLERDGDGTATVDMGPYEYNGSTIPVELASFDADVAHGNVRLTWRTASETNNAGFRVQRRWASLSSWENVGQVDGAGTTSQTQTYTFTDDGIPYGADTLRYRLAQMDLDGKVHYSDPISVTRDVVNRVELLGTYPNPVRTQATLRYSIPERQEVKISLYDVLGQKVRTLVEANQEGRHSTQIDVSDLSSGVYFLRLSSGADLRTERLTIVR